MQRPRCSLIISTYNWPKALEIVLLSVAAQKVLPHEVIIADDGSTPETKALIMQFQTDFPVPLRHLWHEDNGMRKSIIMNKAIAAAKYDYIVAIDGDIIIGPHFIDDHLTYAREGQYLFGSRATITKSHLTELFKTKNTAFNFLSSGITKRGRMLRIPVLMALNKPVEAISSKYRGCNMSFWRSDFIKINGFNESIVGWGKEDSEMVIRLHNAGIRGRRLKFAAIALHIYHPEQSRSRLEANDQIERDTTIKKLTYIENGISQYL